MNRVLPVRRKLCSPGEQAFLFVGIERRDPSGAGERMAGVRIAVEDLNPFRTLHECVEEVLPYEHGSHGDGRIRHPFSHGEEVRNDSEMLRSERLSEASEASDHFVKDQQYSVMRTNLAQALEVADRRYEDAGRARDRLNDDGGNGRGIVQRTQALKLVGELGAVLRLTPGESIARGIVGMADMVDTRDPGAEYFLVQRDTAHRHAAEVDAVVAARATDQPVAPRFAARTVVGERDLERRVGRFGP